MSPHGPVHDAVPARAAKLLLMGLLDRAEVRIQGSFAASDGSEPEPDIAVVPTGEYDDTHPGVAWLVVKVAEASLRKDLGPKARLYAESGVEEYWEVFPPAILRKYEASVSTPPWTEHCPGGCGMRYTFQSLEIDERCLLGSRAWHLREGGASRSGLSDPSNSPPPAHGIQGPDHEGCHDVLSSGIREVRDWATRRVRRGIEVPRGLGRV